MNINVNLKDILNFFTRLSFKIAFFIGIFIYKNFILDGSNNTSKIIVNIIFIISIIFLLDDLIDKTIKIFRKKFVLRKYIKGLKELSKPQIEILVSKYLEIKNNTIIIKPTAYFNISKGEYLILKSKFIIFRAASMQNSFNFPFTLQEWAYNELSRAIKNKKIIWNKEGKTNRINWYGKEIVFKEKQNYDYYEYI